MDHDDDVERLFSWLQDPGLRYREFAGAREVTDTVASGQLRAIHREIEADHPVEPPGTPVERAPTRARRAASGAGR